MVFSFLLATALALNPSPQEGFVTFADAVAAANDGRDAEALVGFQRLANTDPDDLDARLWIARLHIRMGHQGLAEPVYRSVLLEDPADVESRLGVADALLARGETTEAIEILEVAEKLEPQNGEVLSAVGRAHMQEGRTGQAIDYFERAYALSPTEQHRMLLEGARLSYMHRVELRGLSENFTGSTPDTTFGDLLINVRLSDKWRIFGHGQAERKLGVSQQRGGLGAERRWTPSITLRGQALVNPDNTIMPEGDYLGEVQYTYMDATWTGGVRYFDFPGARTTMISPSVQWMPAGRPIALNVLYALSWTDARSLPHDELGQSFHLVGAYRVWPRLWLQTGYAAGVEDFDTFSIDQIGDFRANTASGGFRIELPTLTGIFGNYERQWRARNVDLSRFSLSLKQRF